MFTVICILNDFFYPKIVPMESYDQKQIKTFITVKECFYHSNAELGPVVQN